MVELRSINEENFKECLELKTDVDKDSFVDPVVYSLAEAWLFYENTKAFSIYMKDKLIGFASLFVKKDEYQIINFLISPQYRNQGYGSQAALKCMDYLIKKYHARIISLPVDLENIRGQKFWQKLGFKKSKSIEDGYVFMRYKVG